MKVLTRTLGVALLLCFAGQLLQLAFPAGTAGLVVPPIGNMLVFLSPMAGAVLGLPLLAAAASTSPIGLLRALGALVLEPQQQEREERAAVLARLARSVLAAGLLISLFAAAALFLAVGGLSRMEGGGSPAEIAEVLSWTMLAPSIALGAARLVLAPRADALAARSGTEQRSFHPTEELSQLLFLFPALLAWALVFIPADKL